MKPLSSSVPAITVKISIESSLNGEPNGQLSQNTMLLLQCLNSLNTLSATTPEGLKEASEALESMVKYYIQLADDMQQTSLPPQKKLEVIKGNILPSVVNPPLIMDFE